MVSNPINNLSDEECKSMLESTIKRGNHKSALRDEQRPVVIKLMTQDVELGYSIPLTIESLKKIKQAAVYPVGCQDQLTINEHAHVTLVTLYA